MLCSARSAQPVVFTSIVFLHAHSDGPAVSEESPKQSEVFTRMDASKLYGGLDNAINWDQWSCVCVCVCVCVRVCVCVASFPGSPLTPMKTKNKKGGEELGANSHMISWLT